MCNGLDQQVRQVTQRSVEGVVDPLGAGVCCDFGRQAPQQPSQRLGAVALQREEVLESWPMTPSMIWRLPEAKSADRPSTTPCGNRCLGWPPPAPRIAPSKGALGRGAASINGHLADASTLGGPYSSARGRGRIPSPTGFAPGLPP